MTDTGTESKTRSQTVVRRDVGYITPANLRTGGVLKADPEDFLVEEIPAYLPCGEGEHLFLWIEKQDVSAEYLTDLLSRHLGCLRGEIASAGLKDRRAITRQWISVPGKLADRMESFEHPEIRILEMQRHKNKLRTGHLKGNRFRIRLREVAEGGHEAAVSIAEGLRQTGFLNLYGDQRFGFDNETLRTGLELLRGEKSPRSIPPARRKFLLRLALSAVQSALFNDVLALRLERGIHNQVQAGDVMQVIASGGCFLVEDVAAEQARLQTGETSLTGPMFGPKMKSPEGVVRELELQVMADWGLSPEQFERFEDLTQGTRRPLMIRVDDLHTEEEGDDLILEFELPAGAYATSVVREFQKENLNG